MKKILLLLVLGTTLLISCHKKTQGEKFKEMVTNENKKYPARLDKNITIDSVAYDVPANKLTYYYSLVGELDNDSLIDKNYASLYNQLREAVDNSVEMEKYRKFGTTIQYIYLSGSNKKKLAEFSFNSPK